jgi:8-oxo-dGTP diphosphatase
MIHSVLCYVTQGQDVLMLHRIKKEKDINKDKSIGIGG